MPLYEYECAACHRRTEKIQKFSDPEITICPHCGGHLNRVLSAPAFSFAGGGWYADGYGSAKPAAGTGDTPAAPSSGPASGGESTAPSTPAASATPPSAPAASASSSSAEKK